MKTMMMDRAMMMMMVLIQIDRVGVDDGGDGDDYDDDGQGGCYGGSLGSRPSGKLLRGRNSPFSLSRFFSIFPPLPFY